MPLLLGLAATGPEWHTQGGRHVRTDAQAIFIIDTSRSMAAGAGARAPTRMAQARAAAIELRNKAIPEIPSGVASLTTQLLPHLFPTSNLAAFDTTVEHAIGVERPPPPALELGLTGTSFRPLMELRSTGFFDPQTDHRFAILLTDGESSQFDPVSLAQSLSGESRGGGQGGGGGGGGQFGGQFGGSDREQEAPVQLFIVRLGGAGDRIYLRPKGRLEVGYRPDARAAEIVGSLAAATHSRAFTSVSAAEAGLRKAAGSGHVALQGTRKRTVRLAPFVVLCAFLPLGFVVVRRNLSTV